MRISDLPDDDALLAEYGELNEDDEPADRWRVEGYGHYTRDQALGIIKMCLVMDQPVSSIMSSDWGWGLVARLAELEERVMQTEEAVVNIDGRAVVKAVRTHLRRNGETGW